MDRDQVSLVDLVPTVLDTCGVLEPAANEADADGDGFRLCEGDCDDDDANVRPIAVGQNRNQATLSAGGSAAATASRRTGCAPGPWSRPIP